MKTKQRILIVDDEEAIIFSYKKLLSGGQVEVDGCMCLEDAIALIKSNKYSAVITDFRLSHSESSEGLEILQCIRKYNPTTPVIFFTGYGSDEIKDQVLSLGACSYFDKPVHVAEIVKTLRAMGVEAGIS